MKGSLCLIPNALLLPLKLGSVTKMWNQLSYRFIFFWKGFCSAAPWGACGHPKEMVFQHSITGCGCSEISAGWGRWEGCAVKQGAAALFSLWWTVTAAFMVTVNWGRAPSHTPLCFVLQHWELNLLVFICKWEQEESRLSLSPPLPLYGIKTTLHLLCRKACRGWSFCFLLLWTCEWSRAW